ncbi:Hsp70 family protein [Aspergillus undulatus]|uniref:Hsp70 family protein n=1 Tax=Aspergillus undulatus TaxID=1810928 RepID=UPI003CCCF38B
MARSRVLSTGALDALNSLNARASYNGADGDVTWPLQGLCLREEDDQLVIGIDFGTTFSGAAWVTPESFEADQINLISAWPGTGREEGKAPTELLYDEGKTMWGYNIPGGADTVRGFKLLLLRDEDLTEDVKSSEFYLRARKMLRDTGKTVALGDFVVDGLRFHVVITVPAIWKPYARQGMKDAAKSAGMLNPRKAGETTLSFVPEPEAAALSTLCERGRRIKRGDVFVICDAGGGTVDLISYEIMDTNPIAMREAVEGKGRLCGGLFIDEAFEAMCKRRLGRRWDNLSKKGVNDVMRGEWEQYIKPQFRPGSTHGDWIVGIPAEAFGRSNIDDLSKQPYIKQGRIHFRERTAICRGAIYKGFLHLSESSTNSTGGYDYRSITVASTIARISIGTNIWCNFDESKHLEEDRIWDYNKQTWRANNQMLWYIHKGDDVSTKDRVSHSYHQIVDRDFDGTFVVDMYQCEADVPPTRKASNVKLLCTINCKLDVPTAELKSFHRTDGTKMKHLYYDVVMMPSGAAAECTVYIDGRKQGSQNATIKFQ